MGIPTGCAGRDRGYWQWELLIVLAYERYYTHSIQYAVELQESQISDRDVVSMISALFVDQGLAVGMFLLRLRNGADLALTLPKERISPLIEFLNAHTNLHGAGHDGQAAATARVDEFLAVRDDLRMPIVSEIATRVVKNLHLASDRSGVAVTYETILGEAGSFKLDDVATQGFAAGLDDLWAALPTSSVRAGSNRH
ncbi:MULTISPECIES: hypothetical protein [unclassified Mesorhizobium]|uniref:hypothetical protein n=1 Tax=unclassified Mesorhizobium TaxID=325217 RepID=UPI000FCBB93F|nr:MULTISPECIES: hypothetical protein [unclassified Mesorhizobium]RUW26808.1 hypothetical protein EOA38_26755 [Mesorhizobium sp. M1E.F.Ca.ET.041.01.1.1]RUW75852.1 hypothetical protein EOA31_08270 [Mesorhizobium sp. M4B.F.Ca.ET.049.02.1.2]TIU88675.1 MAG: hypothetical protein E5W03_05875 [Mesorhizobium sp.]